MINYTEINTVNGSQFITPYQIIRLSKALENESFEYEVVLEPHDMGDAIYSLNAFSINEAEYERLKHLFTSEKV